MIPLIFLILTPYPPAPGYPFFGGVGWGGVGWGGSTLLCVLWPLCVYLDPGLEELFSCICTP